ncbi:hypothetical protein J2Y48_000234 [Mycoplana sp. BE70]|uniref:O-antigen ligase family protein n=1 Tax=Mycoplana sp. BE70 TaxID=2817775 RepID=UPI0028549433|nr:O-antigen ligase family protein [Mycoplana sp. BE70]MDR6754961.1 hypothetical protein [Mycoplana sp. BE70]
MVLPCLFRWLSGAAGRFRVADFCLLFYCLWAAISMVVRDGFGAALEGGGILFVETMGSYLLARCFVRSARDYYSVALLFFRCILLLMPFAVFETLTGNNVLLETTRALFTTHYAVPDTRWGLTRVQSVLEHPILFGVVVGSALAPVHLVLGYGQSVIRRYFRTSVVAVTAFLSLSSGPLTALSVQILLLTWNGLLAHVKERWKLFWAVMLAGYAAVAIASNQSVFQFAFTYFSFSPANAYFRVLIWHFGSSSALNHPIFGTGMEDWERPEWMPPSIDMFWLYHAIVYGIPAALAMLAAFLAIFLSVSTRPASADPKLMAYRLAYLAAMASLFCVGWTVHFWNATYVLFLFTLGSGVWLLETEEPATRERDIRPVRGRSVSSSRPATENRRGRATNGPTSS